MDKKANEAYCYYKQQLPDTVCLFRLEDAYVAICDDAVKVANLYSRCKAGGVRESHGESQTAYCRHS